MPTNTQWRLRERPEGAIKVSDFTWHEEPVPALIEGQILVRTLFLSLDPTNRVWAARDSYLPAVGIGEVMRGIAVGRVEESRHDGFKAGDLVKGLLGWQAFSVSDGRGLTRVPPTADDLIPQHLHVLGHIGLTAWAGVVEIGKLKAGETMVVTAAAGGVGSLAAQIGKLRGARVIGIAGTAEKCAWLTGDLGLDGAINYKTEPFRARLKTLCPNGIDVHFENVGGALLEAAIANIALHGRIALCGMIALYAAESRPPGPSNLDRLVSQRARIEGFLVNDFGYCAKEAFTQLGAWLAEGRLQSRLTIVDGLAHAPEALNRLFDGSHEGKMLIGLSLGSGLQAMSRTPPYTVRRTPYA